MDFILYLVNHKWIVKSLPHFCRFDINQNKDWEIEINKRLSFVQFYLLALNEKVKEEILIREWYVVTI